LDANVWEMNAFARGRAISQMGDRACHRTENDDTRVVRVCVPRLRETTYAPYDEYVPSGVAILGDFKS